MPRSLLAGLVVALAAVAPAAARAQSFDQAAPTLAFDQPCYSPGDRMSFTGAGYAPGSAVELMFTTPGHAGSYVAQADPAGAIADYVMTPDPDHFLAADEWSARLSVTSNGATRTEVTLSRWDVQIGQPGGGRVRAGRPMRVIAVGFTNAIGKTLYVHYVRGGRRVRTVRIGRLDGDCGDRTGTLRRALPRGLRRGAYKLVFNPSAVDPGRTPRVWIRTRLR